MQIDFVQKILKRTVEMMFESWKKMIFEIVSLPEYRLLVLHSFWLQQKNFNKILGQSFMCDVVVVVVAVVHESFLRKHFWQFFGKFTEQKMKNVIHVKVGIAAIQSFSLSTTIQSCLPQVCQIQLLEAISENPLTS